MKRRFVLAIFLLVLLSTLFLAVLGGLKYNSNLSIGVLFITTSKILTMMSKTEKREKKHETRDVVLTAFFGIVFAVGASFIHLGWWAIGINLIFMGIAYATSLEVGFESVEINVLSLFGTLTIITIARVVVDVTERLTI
jgi:hypothetical protein